MCYINAAIHVNAVLVKTVTYFLRYTDVNAVKAIPAISSSSLVIIFICNSSGLVARDAHFSRNNCCCLCRYDVTP